MVNRETYDILINRRSGTVLRTGEAQVEKDLRDVFAAAVGSISFTEGADIAASVRRWLDDSARRENTLVIGGGDGTVLSAAEQVFDKDVTLGVLPLGTQNFVARKLGFSPHYKDAAAQFKDSTVTAMDVGSVNGHYFLYGFLMDKGSVDLFAAREATRNGDYKTTLAKAFSFASGILWSQKQKMRLMAQDGTAAEAEGRMLAVTNNAFTPRSSKGVWPVGNDNLRKVYANAFAKPEHGDGMLAFYAHQGGLWPLIRSMPKVWNGTWDKGKDLTVLASRAFTIEPASGQKNSGRIAVILDGETQMTAYPLNVQIHPQALKLRSNLR